MHNNYHINPTLIDEMDRKQNATYVASDYNDCLTDRSP